MTDAVGLLTDEGRELGAVFFDYDLDGDPDLFQGNDATPNFLWRNDGDRFAEVGWWLRGVQRRRQARGDDGRGCGRRRWRWSPRLGDDQFPVGEQHAVPQRGWRDVCRRIAGCGYRRNSLDRLAFGINFLDADNDGDPDLYVANGHIDEDIDQFDPQAAYGQSDQFYLNDGQGRFADASVGTGVAAPTRDLVGRGSAVADYDNDGDLDIFLVNTGQRALLWRNDTQAGHYLALALEGADE